MQGPFQKLVHELSKLPSIGQKTAERLVLHLARQPAEVSARLAYALNDTMGQLKFCKDCGYLATDVLCSICQNTKRDKSTLCVVEDIADVQAFEATQSYKGLYHVLHGALSPIDGIGPEQLRLKELLNRLNTETPVLEVVLATNHNVNGDATALYVARLIKPFQICVSRLATGLPLGSHIEFIDAHTLSRALNARVMF